MTRKASFGADVAMKRPAVAGTTVTPLVTSALGAKLVRDRLFVFGITLSASTGAKRVVVSETGSGTTRTFAEIFTVGANVENVSVLVGGVRLS